MSTHSVDDLLVKSMQNQQAPVQAIPNAPEPEPTPEITPEPPQIPPTEAELPKEPEVPQGTSEQELPEKSEKAEKSSPIDEYGNPIEKPKTYTEDEVQRMIRDRLSRGRNAEPAQQPTPLQVQKTAEDFQADPNSEETWETQLNTFIDKRLETRQTENEQKEWKAKETQKQADFEAKFNLGMTKYQDFQQVVGKVASSITNSMMLAARNLDNPAAFVYAAAKLHPQELERISHIGDAYAQAAEVGRLHERMVKQRAGASNAPKPIEAPKGDMTNKPINSSPSIDQRIFEHAKAKRR